MHAGTCTEGDFRLVGGSNDFEGRVAIYGVTMMQSLSADSLDSMLMVRTRMDASTQHSTFSLAYMYLSMKENVSHCITLASLLVIRCNCFQFRLLWSGDRRN